MLGYKNFNKQKLGSRWGNIKNVNDDEKGSDDVVSAVCVQRDG